MNVVLSASAVRTSAPLLPEPTGDVAGVDAAGLSSLIGAIYDTTLDPGRWMEVIPQCRDFVGGASAAIFSKDISGAGQVYYHDDRLDPGYVQLYFERYVRLDPSNVGHIFAEVDEPVSISQIFDYDEHRQSRFFREWAEPQGLVDLVTSPLEKRGAWAAMFGVFRHKSHGLVDHPTRERMRLIVPHIRRAVLIGRAVENGRAQAANFEKAFDGLAAGMFLVDAQGHVVHANAAGSAMLGDGGTVNARDGRIVSVDRAAAAALADVLAVAAHGDAAVGTRGISIGMQGGDGEHYVAHVLPLTSGERRGAAAAYTAVAALFVQKATLEAPAAPEVIARAYGLTASELRVLMTTVQSGGVAETADALGIGESTVRTHLHRLFAKTGAQRQADLVRLMAGYASPFVR
jgi:DNA-binding CsgD family transcriptional regulator/PAS domain-containing protein